MFTKVLGVTLVALASLTSFESSPTAVALTATDTYSYDYKVDFETVQDNEEGEWFVSRIL